MVCSYSYFHPFCSLWSQDFHCYLPEPKPAQILHHRCLIILLRILPLPPQWILFPGVFLCVFSFHIWYKLLSSEKSIFFIAKVPFTSATASCSLPCFWKCKSEDFISLQWSHRSHSSCHSTEGFSWFTAPDLARFPSMLVEWNIVSSIYVLKKCEKTFLSSVV